MRTKLVVLSAVVVMAFFGGTQISQALPHGASLVEQNGLDWLSPVWSQNISQTDMANRLKDPTSDYYGLRFATSTEMAGMLNSYELVHPFISGTFNFGVTPGLYSRTFGPAYGVMNPFFDQFGFGMEEVSRAPNFARALGGYLFDPDSGDTFINIVDEHDIYGGLFSPDAYELTIDTIDAFSFERPWVGSWLVAAPVPEPSTVVLLGFGILLLVGGYKKRRVRTQPVKH